MNTFPIQKRMSLRRGFTLIELLVAVGVTALLVSMMLGIVVNITGGWNRSSGSLESGNQARVVLDQITSDLQAAIIKNDNNIWMVASPGIVDGWSAAGQNTGYIPPAVPPALPKLEEYRFGAAGVWFRFFSTVPGTNTAGQLSTLSAPRAVAYRMIRRAVVAGSNEHRYQLYRSEVSPDLTFAEGYNLAAGGYIATGTGNTPGSIRTPEAGNIIANNVVDFGVRILDSAGNILFPTSTAMTEYRATSGATLPDSVEIFVRILSGEGAQLLANKENPPTGYTPPANPDWWSIVQAHSRVYTRHVELKSKGL